MAVSSCRMRKEVMCERGALASAEVYLRRKRGRRRFRRAMRSPGDGDGDGEGGGVAYVRRGGSRGRLRRMRRNIIRENYLAIRGVFILQVRCQFRDMFPLVVSGKVVGW